MNAKDLKNSILQRAIQGKLVEQRDEEGTSKELIENIKVEREQLIKEKKIKKEKKLPKITDDEIPFDIPESWEWVRLVDLADTSETPIADGPFGSNLKREHYVSEPEVRIIQLSNIGENGWKNENIKYTSYIHAETIKRRKVSIGDIVIAKMMPAGRAIEVPDVESDYILSLDVVKFVPHKLLYKKYLLNAINSSVFRSQIYAEVQGITRVRTSLTKLKKYLIPLPPLEEQKRIVAKIEELMPYVEKYNQFYSEVEELNKKFPEDMQKSILQYAIQGKLVEQREEEGTAEELYQQIQKEKERLIKESQIKKAKKLPEINEDEIPFDIPESWKWVYIDEIAFVTKLSGSEYTKYISNSILSKGEIPIVRAKNVKPNHFMENEEEFITRELSEKLSRCALDTRCILMTFVGTRIGEVAIFENRRRNHLAPNVAKIVPYVGINNYLLYYFMSYSGQREIFKFIKRTAQSSLSMETIRKVRIALPPFEEQKRIVEKIEELLSSTKQLVK